MENYVLYHANCFDGMVSAWAFWKKFADSAKYIPVAHGAPLPEIQEGAIVYIVDFSYKRPVMDELNERVLLTVLDHHVSATKELEGAPYATFDMNKSGAMLAWEFCFPLRSAPSLVKYVQDRDLWQFKLPWSKEINAYIQSWPMTFADYESAHRTLSRNFSQCRREGEAIERYKASMVEKICENPRLTEIRGYTVPIVNTSILYAEVGDRLALTYPDAPFAAYYYDRNDGFRQFGLYSRGEFDVSRVARSLGGGGHKGAAGFQIKQHEDAFLEGEDAKSKSDE